jgi:hypothetical protein
MQHHDSIRAAGVPQSSARNVRQQWRPRQFPELHPINPRRWQAANVALNILVFALLLGALVGLAKLVVLLAFKALAVLAMAPAGFLRRKRNVPELESKPALKRSAKPEPLMCVCGQRMAWRAKRRLLVFCVRHRTLCQQRAARRSRYACNRARVLRGRDADRAHGQECGAIRARQVGTGRANDRAGVIDGGQRAALADVPASPPLSAHDAPRTAGTWPNENHYFRHILTRCHSTT